MSNIDSIGSLSRALDRSLNFRIKLHEISSGLVSNAYNSRLYQSGHRILI